MYLICPCLYSYWYPLYSASLGRPGQCTYLPVFALVLVPLVQCFALSARQCTYLPVFVLVLVSLVQCFAWSARAVCLFSRFRTSTVRESLHSVYCACTPCTAFPWASTSNVPICPCSYSYWYPLCSALLGQHGQCTYIPVLVSLYSVLVWVTRAMYVSSCLDFYAVLVALLLLTWTVCW